MIPAMRSRSSNESDRIQIGLTRPAQLTREERVVWRGLLESEVGLDSPFFHLAFVQAVAEVQPDIEVAVLEDQGRPVGFFPFQRDRWNIGRPVGGRLADFQGPIIQGTVPLNDEHLLRASGLRLWHFSHLVASRPHFRRHHAVACDSPYMDLRSGWTEYVRQQKSASNQIGTTLRKSRKLAREIGPLRFEFHTTSGVVFDRLLAWKSEQLQRRKTLDVLRFRWVVDLLEQIRQAEWDGFAGVLSALYSGDELVAAHLGMRTDRALHIWFPAFDRRFGAYSPGLVLLVRLAQHCIGQGIERIDLGRGPERYKRGFRSGAIELAEGAVSAQPITRVVCGACYRSRNWVRSSPLRPVSQVAKQLFRRVRHSALPHSIANESQQVVP